MGKKIRYKKCISMIIIIVVVMSICLWITNDTWAETSKGNSLIEVNRVSNEDGLNFVIENGVLVKYNGYQEHVEVPEGVTEIGERAFEGNTSMKIIELPGTITAIGSWAFHGCISLVDIELPEYLTEVNFGVFSGCSSLVGINIPENVISIHSWAFENCSNLSYVKFPDVLEYLGHDVFQYCNKLKTVEIPASLTWCDIGANDNGPFADCANLKNVNFETGVTTIVSNLFSNCKSLEKIELPDTITAIGAGAFENCIGLTTIDIPEYVTNIEVAVFRGCSNLQSVNIPDGVTEIGKQAFSGCVKLEKIKLPASLGSIGSEILYDCNLITSINIPSGIWSAGTTLDAKGPFSGCQNLKQFDLDKTMTNIPAFLFEGCESLEEIILPSLVVEIGTAAFRGCTNLKSIQLPDGLLTIRSSAFEDCLHLENIELPNQVSVMDDGVFMGCTALKNIQIPDRITEIKDNMFKDCKALTDISLPNRINYIGDYAFEGCSKLAKVILPARVQRIGVNCFNKCTSLTTVKLGIGLNEIKNSAFESCSQLNNVVITNAVNTIGDSAFAKCTSLTKIVIPESVSDIGKDVFSYKGKMQIYGRAGSYVQSYAESEKIPFIDVSYPITKMEFDFVETVVGVREYSYLDLNIEPDITTDRLNWEVDNSVIADIDENGCIHGWTEGSVQVTVTASSGVSAQCTVFFGKLPEELRMEQDLVTLTVLGKEEQLKVNAIPDTSICKNIIWKSNNPEIAAVDQQGKVQAVSNGTATITASIKGTDLSTQCVVLCALIQQENEQIVIDMKDTKTVTPELLNAVRQADSTLILDMNEYTWKIDGKDIKEGISDNIELLVDKEENIVPQPVMEEAFNNYEIEYNAEIIQPLTLKHSGTFGFTAYLNCEMPESFHGKTANLFYYNERTKKLELIGNYSVDQVGNIEIPFYHASSYLLLGTDKELENQYKLGDLNGDGTIDIFDIQIVQRHIMEVQILSDALYVVADINKDGEVDIFDIQKMQRHIMEVELIE